MVDDDPNICINFKNILLKGGYKVRIAHTGEAAIALVQKKTPDIIFIDMKLPTINGLETYLAIKKVNPEAVVIMITAYRQEMTDLAEEAVKESAYACIYKPINIEETLKLIEAICVQKQKRK